MKYDDELKKALNLRAENFSVDENMLYSIKRKIKNQRRIGMNKFKKAVIVCCTVLVIGVTGVCRNGIRSGCNKRDFANAIVTLEKLNIIRKIGRAHV